MPPGRALPLVKALLRLGERTSRWCELLVLSPASADASPRLFASVHEHALQVTRAAFTVTARCGDVKRPTDQLRIAFDGNAAIFA